MNSYGTGESSEESQFFVPISKQFPLKLMTLGIKFSQEHFHVETGSPMKSTVVGVEAAGVLWWKTECWTRWALNTSGAFLMDFQFPMIAHLLHPLKK